MGRKLTGSEKRQIAAAIKKAKAEGKLASAQNSIPYQEMYPDGMCRVDEKFYTKTLGFGDVNYQLATGDDKNAIFEAFCELHNYFDHSVPFQFCYVNQRANLKAQQSAIAIPEREDGFQEIRDEFGGVLKRQMARGNNGMEKRKYMTFGVEADAPDTARHRLERIEIDVMNQFKALGVPAWALDGWERLKVLHGIFHGGGEERFYWNWDLPVGTGLCTKDFIAPSSFDFSERRTFRSGAQYGAVSYLQILAPELSDKMLSEFLELGGSNITVSIHFCSLNQNEAIKQIKRSITDLDRMKIDAQKKAIRSGYDMDILPSDLTTYGGAAKQMLEDLQQRNERMFHTTILITQTAGKRRELENAVFAARNIAQKYNCSLVRLDDQQEDGFMSSTPIGKNTVPIQRGLTTSAAAIFVPFSTPELLQHTDSALYYGVNAISHNLIMADRKTLKNPNGMVLGTPGSGKSFSVKREITNVFLTTEDDIRICDPEAEYRPLVEALGGQVIELSPTSKDYINLMDISLSYADGDNPLALQADFLLSICELIMGGKMGLEPVEKTIIDRCVRIVYRKYMADPKPQNMPVLGDFQKCIKAQPEPEAQRIATALEMYTTGSLNVFNHKTNVNLENRLVCYDIKKLGKGLKKLAMQVVQNQFWACVNENQPKGKYTRCYIDEFHLLLMEEQTANFSVEIWKRFRKFAGIPTGLTQNVKDLLRSREIANILENSDFILMLNQGSGDREILAKHLGISPYQLSYVTNSGPGEGLLFFGDTIVPFVDQFPRDTKLYRLMSTRPGERAQDREG